MDRSRHPITKYTNVEMTHAAINKKMFKRLGLVSDQFPEVQFAKYEIEHREQIIVGFLILQYAELRFLELFNIFFTKTCYTDMYEEMEMETESICV